MEFDVQIKSEVRKDLIEKVIPFYAKQLNVKDFDYTIIVKNNKILRKEHQFNGQVYYSGYRELTIELDSYLKLPRLLITLAHEMVHVKQMVRGQYQLRKARNGRIMQGWCGKRVKADYLDRPWEIEAFKREEILFGQLCDKINGNKRKRI